ncbi:MAG: hypothetical protein PVH61_44400 [Candidatus Aminicenantes bacterium]
MNSYLDEDFIKYFNKLPERIKKRSKKVYRQWKENPFEPRFQFKQVHNSKPIYSVRVNIGWRALGYKKNNTVLWFWIGSHEDYNKIITQF